MATEISRDTSETLAQALVGLMGYLAGPKVGDTSKFVVVEAYNGGLGVYPVSRGAGERNEGSSTNSYLAVRQECNMNVISKTTAVTIGAGAANDTQLMSVLLLGPLTGTCVIAGFADSDGAAQSITIPAGTTARSIDFLAALNTAGALTITCSNAADDNLVCVFWKPA